MLSFIISPAIDLCADGEFDHENTLTSCHVTAVTALVAGAAMLLNRKTYNFQPKWIWPAAALILIDPSLVASILYTSNTMPKSEMANLSIALTSMLVSGLTFALLPRKAANIGLATALPLSGCVTLASLLFKS